MSDGEKRAQKEAFKISKVNDAVRSADPKLFQIFNDLYQRTIDFGGHPNPQGTFSAMTMVDRGDGTSLTSWAMTGDNTALLHAFKSVAQVGGTSLHVLQHVFKARFELLGLRQELQALRTTGVYPTPSSWRPTPLRSAPARPAAISGGR